MAKTYLSIPNWREMQHYKDRKPLWIKLHIDVLARYEFACLQDASKAHLFCIWVLAAEYDNRVPNDASWIARKIMATEPVDLEALIGAGFLVVEGADGVEGEPETLTGGGVPNLEQPASKPLADSYGSFPDLLASETETETENTHPAGAREPGTMTATLARGIAAGEALAATPGPDPLPADLEALAVALLDRVATLRHEHGKFAEVGKDRAQTRVLVEVYTGPDVRAMAREYPDACRELIPRALEPGDPLKLGKGLTRPNCLAYLSAAVVGWVRGESGGGRGGQRERDRAPVWVKGPDMPDAPAHMRAIAE